MVLSYKGFLCSSPCWAQELPEFRQQFFVEEAQSLFLSLCTFRKTLTSSSLGVGASTRSTGGRRPRSLLESPWIYFCRQAFSCGEAERLFIESSCSGNLSPLSSLHSGSFDIIIGERELQVVPGVLTRQDISEEEAERLFN